MKDIIDKIKYEEDLATVHNNQEMVTKIIDDYQEFTKELVEISISTFSDIKDIDIANSILIDEEKRVIKQIKQINEGICKEQIAEKCKGIMQEARKELKNKLGNKKAK